MFRLLQPRGACEHLTQGSHLPEVKAHILSEAHKALHDLPRPLRPLPLTHSAPATGVSWLFLPQARHGGLRSGCSLCPENPPPPNILPACPLPIFEASLMPQFYSEASQSTPPPSTIFFCHPVNWINLFVNRPLRQPPRNLNSLREGFYVFVQGPYLLNPTKCLAYSRA